MSIKASATDEIISSSPADIRAFYGDSISFSYFFNGVEYTDTFTYFKTKNGGTNVQFEYVDIENNIVANNGYTFGAYDYIVYRCQTGRAEAYLTDVSVSGIYTNYSGYVRGGFGMSVWPTGFSVPNKSYNTISSYPDNYVGSNQAQSSNTNSSLYNWAWMPSDYYSSGGNSSYLACRWNLFFSQNGFTVDEITFSGVQTSNYGDLFFVIMCPVYGGDMLNTDPSQTTTTTETNSGGVVTTGDISVDVNIDLDETNGILGDILSVLSDFVGDIIDGIKGLFVPDEDYLENWLSDLVDLFETKFFYSGIDIEPLKNALLDMATYGATTSIRFPGIDLTSCGIPFTIPPRSVVLQPFGSPINTYIELSINIAATLAVFNLFFTKIKAILVGERVVEVEGDDE